MSKPIDDMTPDELRDALAVAAGWTQETNMFHGHAVGPFPTGRWIHAERNLVNTHPIPALDTPEALGVVAGMMPDGWATLVHTGYKDTRDWHASWSRVIPAIRPDISVFGPTEVIARARLVLKVLASRSASPPKPSAPTSAPSVPS